MSEAPATCPDPQRPLAHSASGKAKSTAGMPKQPRPRQFERAAFRRVIARPRARNTKRKVFGATKQQILAMMTEGTTPQAPAKSKKPTTFDSLPTELRQEVFWIALHLGNPKAQQRNADRQVQARPRRCATEGVAGRWPDKRPRHLENIPHACRQSREEMEYVVARRVTYIANWDRMLYQFLLRNSPDIMWMDYRETKLLQRLRMRLLYERTRREKEEATLRSLTC